MKSKDFNVDVIIPVFNGEKTVRTAIESVLNQTTACVQKVIVINDGSTDNTLIEINKIDDERLECFTTSNRGVSVARNEGILLAQSEWIAFLDADDVWSPQKLSIQLDVASNHDVDFLCCAAGTELKRRQGMMSIASLWRGNYVATSSVILKRQVASENMPLFNSKMNFSEDYSAWFKLLIKHKGYFISEPLVLYKVSLVPHYRFINTLFNFWLFFKEAVQLVFTLKLPFVKKIGFVLVLTSGIVISTLSIIKRFLYAH